MNEVAYFEIMAENPEATVDFYKKVFGWKIEKDRSMPITYYRISSEGILGAIMQKEENMKGEGINSFVSSIIVSNFDKIEHLILEHGGSIAVEKFLIPNVCWQGYFKDIDGNQFGIFQVLETA